MAADDNGFAGSQRRPARDWSLIGLSACFLLLVAAVLATIWLTIRMQQASELVTHTLEVENELSIVLSRLQDAETSGRGFLLTGRSDFLQPYDEAVAALPRELARLRERIGDNPRQVAALTQLQVRAGQRLRHIRISVDNYWRGTPTTPEHFLRGKAIMDEARDAITAMKEEEARLLEARTATAGRRAALLALSLVASVVLVLAFGLLALRGNRRRLADAVAARDALTEVNRQLTAEAENREVAETKVRQMQKIEAVGQLTGGIAHDFNNMLTLVIGSLDLGRRKLEKGELAKVEKCMGNAMEGAQHAAQLTARLLAFSRQQPLAPQPLDANKLVGGMSELLRRTIGEQLRMETVLAGGLWRTYIDPNQLESAIVNLCLNARDATLDGGKLTIETANAHLDEDYAADHPGIEAGQYVLISVTDTGAGMPPEVMERAFDPFYTTKGPGRGTGLGLSQVYGFVRQSQGHLKIYSEAGHGTTVKLYLPRYRGDEDVPAEVAEVPDLPRARDHEIILVVEDDDRVRHVSVDALRELGYTVVQASDGNQALAVLAVQPLVGLLFTDVVMPDMNGRQLAQKAQEAKPDLKVLYTTGYTRNAIVHNGMLDSDVALLAKPFTVEQLARKVRQVLDETVTAEDVTA
ncbi:CHASE3 domain-containing protein [Sphingosinicella sp. LHD-64]|uniref:CHASE3 domain-containing protein n=1 Tax=Sphingosinicella sp. LHD-64 TaxID=3072139 RepID=UPI00280E679F|nr:CHASE3 domain-containing protein [Sphingosinicella sp. LHD-64]MDQ8755358.1 CHASE3 domain-containing protein [Sphingosinicella sp. LHD-64]